MMASCKTRGRQLFLQLLTQIEILWLLWRNLILCISLADPRCLIIRRPQTKHFRCLLNLSYYLLLAHSSWSMDGSNPVEFSSCHVLPSPHCLLLSYKYWNESTTCSWCNTYCLIEQPPRDSWEKYWCSPGLWQLKLNDFFNRYQTNKGSSNPVWLNTISSLSPLPCLCHSLRPNYADATKRQIKETKPTCCYLRQ